MLGLREDGSVFCIYYWPSPVQSFLGPRPFGLETIFYCLRFETSLFVTFYDSQVHGGGIRPHLHTGWLTANGIWFCYIASAWTPQKTPFPAVFLLLNDTYWHELHRKHHFLELLHCFWRLLSHCLVTGMLTELFPSNGRFSGSTILAFSRHATLSLLLYLFHFFKPLKSACFQILF
jgi:hypothetical protein